MEGRPSGILLYLITATLVSLAGAQLCLCQEAIEHNDVKIRGKEIVTFTDGREPVLIVVGDFQLTLGKRTITGRDAVVWVNPIEGDQAARNRITVYVEGNARDVAADGKVTSDSVMLISILQQGKLGTVADHLSERQIKDFPLYQRAVAARQRTSSAKEPQTGQDTDAGAPSTQPASTSRPSETTTQPIAPVIMPIQFSADRFTSRMVGNKRITVARGHVYVAQGSSDSADFLELRGQAAVIFSEKLDQPKLTRSPISPKLGKPEEETITGVYLEGDVIMARGERSMQAQRAYYDFVADRGYIPDGVLRTVQEQRNIPIYIRADEIRTLSAREMYFRNAKVTSSDFRSPSYHIGAKEAYLMDTTPYDEEGKALGPQAWQARMKHTTFNVRSVPLVYTPFWKGDLEQGHSALRTASIGSHGDFGLGVETEWHLFRLLGLSRPKGVRAYYELNWYEEGLLTGIKFHYARQNEMRRYTGYGRIFGLFAGDDDDDFGDQREDIPAPDTRGRVLWRHKEYLPSDWEAQFEVSYMCDRNFLERYWPTEFYAGKEQETLIYAKKQRDNWAFTALAKYRINDFLTQDEASPDLGFYLTGEPLWGDRLTLFSESHAGLRRFRPDNDTALESSHVMARLDTREEVDFPIRIGPAQVVPYAVGRLSYWSDEPTGGENFRPYGQVGAKALTQLWRVYPQVVSRLWDLAGLRHIITPQLAVFFSDAGGVSPNELFALDPDIEEHLRRVNGFSAGVYQRLQTKRGPAGEQHLVDWMRLDVVASFFDNGADLSPADGKFYLYRPEYSLGRNHVNADYSWYLSDTTTFLADLNWDTDDGRIERAAAGLSIVRSPRLAYYAGMRIIRDMDSAIGTFGAKYRINRKYTISFFEQYDFDFRGRRNLATNVSIVRKLERWYAAVTFTFDQSDEGDTFGLMLSLWPEGVPEVRIGGGTRSALLKKSDMN